MKKFTLKCYDYTPIHVRFYLYDPTGYHCGTIVFAEEHIPQFLKQCWRGKVDWNDKRPKIIEIDSNKGSISKLKKDQN